MKYSDFEFLQFHFRIIILNKLNLNIEFLY